MTRQRLERAVYQFFSETRMYEGKEFFQPVDSRGRPMVPVYLALLTQLTSSDIRSIRRFYLQHGTTALAARQWIEAQHARMGGAGAAVEITPAEAAALSAVRILTPSAASALQRGEQLMRAVEDAPLDSSDSSGSDAEGPDRAAHTSADAYNLLAPQGVAISLYLVHSARGDLVKVGITEGTYEQCRAKYSTVYGSLDAFHFLAVENGKMGAGLRSVSALLRSRKSMISHAHCVFLRRPALCVGDAPGAHVLPPIP
jgi:hypothetical protein